MSLAELLPAIHALPRADKLRLMQVLVTDIANEEAISLPPADLPHTVWAPYDSHDAAAILLQILHEDKGTGG